MAFLHFSARVSPTVSSSLLRTSQVPTLLNFWEKFPASLPNKRLIISPFRFKDERRLQVKPRLHPVFASNTNPSEGSNETKRADAAQGPPFLTIVAGFLVFAFLCWIVGSIVMWIFGLIVHPPPLK